jgi:putative hydrolase of the HAD superfamily
VDIDAVIFDWGGTLTPWHQVDLLGQWYAYAQVYDPPRAGPIAAALRDAEVAQWTRHIDTGGAGGTGSLEQVFAAAGVDTDRATHPAALAAYLAGWDPHTCADPDAVPLLTSLHEAGIAVGVLSNTLWPRSHHEQVFARDGLLHLIDGAVYTSETASGKPHAAAFHAALAAVGSPDPARTVFVGDRPWDDVHGAQQVGMRAVLLPHTWGENDVHVPREVTPDAIVQRLGDVLDVVRAWSS